MSVEEKLADLGIELPTKLAPGSGLAPCRQVGQLLYVSGHGPEDNQGKLQYVGQVGGEVSVSDAYRAARLTGNGIHARSAIGTSSLPMNQPVEIELIVALRD